MLSEQKISQTEGSLGVNLADYDRFGYAVAHLGDQDGDGTSDLAVGAWTDDEGGTHWLADRGAVYVLFLNPDGTVKATQKIATASGGLVGPLSDGDYFGCALAALGDVNGDGTVDVAVGAWRDDAADPWTDATDYGAVWLLFLSPLGTVVGGQYINALIGGFGGTLDEGDHFGASIAPVGDLDRDGVLDMVVGTSSDDDGFDLGAHAGALWFLFLRGDGTVRSELKISDTIGGLNGGLSRNSRFGCAVAPLADFDGDGSEDVVVGAFGDVGGTGMDYGAVYTLLLRGCPDVAATNRNPDVGGHINEDVYSVPGLPIIGSTFTASIVTTGYTGCLLVGFSSPATFATPWGNALVETTDSAGELLGTLFASGDPAVFSIPIPDDPVYCGIYAYTQAIRIGGGIDLTNARDLVLGR